MIEIVPNENSFRGSYNVPFYVHKGAYLYIYNDIFVKEWNKYIKKNKADSDFIKSKWYIEESASDTDMPFDTLSISEKLKNAAKVSAVVQFRKSMSSKSQRMVDDFDKNRNLIFCYNSKLYIYEIQTSFADHISVYMIEKNEVAHIINYLYMKFKKRDRVNIKKQLFNDFKIDDNNEAERSS